VCPVCGEVWNWVYEELEESEVRIVWERCPLCEELLGGGP